MVGEFLMSCLYYDYRFKTEKYNNSWRCITTHTYENMELYFRKQFSMNRLLSSFKKAFHIATVTLKNSTEDKYYEKKILAIYLLCKYSKESFEVIAKEFITSLETVKLISTNSIFQTSFQEDIKLFFKQFEDDYLEDRKSVLAFRETISLGY